METQELAMMTTRDIVRQKLANVLLHDPSNLSAEGMIFAGMAVLREEMGKFDLLEDIRKFHEKFNMSYVGKPRPLPDHFVTRTDFLQTEIDELKEACKEGDLVKQLDALIDILYVAIGTIYLQGFPLYPAWAEIHRSNMSKEVVAWGKGKYGWTVLKGKNYEPPKLEFILDLHS